MKITLRGQTKAERDHTAIGQRTTVTPRSDLVGPGGRRTVVVPRLGNVAGPRRPPDAIWTNKK